MQQFNVQLWPGFDSSIRQYAQDLLLNCDVIHKVMRRDTAYQLLVQMRGERENPGWRENYQRSILGATVLTRYNNKTYRVDDVTYEESPQSKFSMKDGATITIQEYYEKVSDFSI